MCGRVGEEVVAKDDKCQSRRFSYGVCDLHVLCELGLFREVEIVTPHSGACNHNGLTVEVEGAYAINEGIMGESS